MRVAVVTGFLRSGWGYQENYWLEELLRAGHEARMIVAGPAGSEPEPVTVKNGTYHLHRVPAWCGPRAIHRCRHVCDVLATLQPHIILWSGQCQFFGTDILTDPRIAGAAVVTFFGQNLGMHEFDWRKPGIPLKERLHAIGFHLLRGPVSRKSCRRSDLIVNNTPQTRPILLSLFGNGEERAAIDRKMVDLPLGFGIDEFRHDPELRGRVRDELGLAADDMVVCMSSRFAAGKKQEVLAASIGGILKAVEADSRLKAIVIGFSDNAVSEGFRSQIAAHPACDRVIQHEFADLPRLNALYNAGDVAVFGNASISCQSALGTGLTACLADNGSMNHLITMPNQGFFFRMFDADDVARSILDASAALGGRSVEDRLAARREMAHGAAWLGYDQIIQGIIDRVSPMIKIP